jgi:Zn-dependent peptidase ImmA (M78 family)/DNA-binding XRE family transcriptional regulator
MPVDLGTLGRRLKEARINAHRSQEEVASQLGLSRAALIQIEAGERPVDLAQLDALACTYNRSAGEFLEERAEDVLVALLRATPDLGNQEEVETEILRHVAMCRAGRELEGLLELPQRSGPPAYALPAPESVAEAIEQGNSTARQDRQRLGLGDNPVPDMAELISSTGIWATGSQLPDVISGLFLQSASFGMVILVHFMHPRARKRFSYAHEYAHALLDRNQTATVSTLCNRTDLLEVRANAFAAAFLLPSGGVRRFLQGRRKGLQSRLEALVYDPSVNSVDEQVRATQRTTPGSQKITVQDVAALAHRFGTSRQAAAYRLKGLGFINARELNELLEKLETGREYFETLHLYQDPEAVNADPNTRDRELVSQIADLAIEAYRRDQITRERLGELGGTLGIGGRKLVMLAEAAK